MVIRSVFSMQLLSTFSLSTKAPAVYSTSSKGIINSGMDSALSLNWVKVADAGLKGFGLFSTHDIPYGYFIGSYEGETLKQKDYMKRYPKGESVYVFLVYDGQHRDKLYVDASDNSMSNPTRYMNHDGVSPNVMYYIESNLIMKPNKNDMLFQVRFHACRDIKVGEELTFDYGPRYANNSQTMLSS